MSDRIRAIHGDSREVLKTLADCSVDSVVCDPPYSLVSIVKRFGNGQAPAKGNTAYMRASAGFMGQKWDTGETAHDPEFWREVYRVLKPGAHVVAFGGTRTFHRLVCAIEDAGFEVRDQIAWIFGSGFPKSHDVSKGIDRAAGVERTIIGRAKGAASSDTYSLGEFRNEYDATIPATDSARQWWQGWGTALKPALEPICLARKPLVGTVAANVQQFGTGAINVDGCRVGFADEGDRAAAFPGGRLTSHGAGSLAGPRAAQTVERAGFSTERSSRGRWPANVIHDGSEEVVGVFPESESGTWDGHRNGPKTNGVYGLQDERGRIGSSGSAARFFYTAKADSEDRIGSKHPTVKPIDLMQYLIRLVTPKVVWSCTKCESQNADSTTQASTVTPVQELRSGVPPEGQSAHEQVLQPPLRDGENEASEKDVRELREDIPAERGPSALLHPDVSQSLGSADTALDKGVRDNGEGVQAASLDAKSSEREARLYPRTSLRGGAGNRSAAGAARGRAPQERDQVGQPPRKLGTPDEDRPRQNEATEAGRDNVPTLQRPHPNQPSCARCGSTLVKRPGLCLDPFAGTGTTGEAAFREGMRALLIEREPQYFEDIQRRLKLMMAGPDERARESIKANGKTQDAGPLFA